jgi:hypothetical protein
LVIKATDRSEGREDLGQLQKYKSHVIRVHDYGMFQCCLYISVIPACFLGVRGNRLRHSGSSSSDSLSSVLWAGGRDGPVTC